MGNTSATSTLLSRVSERLGHPILAAYLIIFCTREWPFLLGVYKAFFGPAPVPVESRLDAPGFQLAIEQASKFFNWWDAVALNLSLAVVVVAGLPFIDRMLNRYSLWHAKRKELETARSVEAFPLTREQLRASSLYQEAAKGQADLRVWLLEMGKIIHSLGDQSSTYVLCRADHTRPVLHHIVRAVAIDDSGMLKAFPLDGAQARDSLVVYVVDEHVSGRERYLLCAQNNSLVPTPPGHPPQSRLGSDAAGRLTPITAEQSERVIHLEADTKVPQYLRIRTQLGKTLPSRSSKIAENVAEAEAEVEVVD